MKDSSSPHASYFFFFLLCSAVYGILVPQPGSNLCPLQWNCSLNIYHRGPCLFLNCHFPVVTTCIVYSFSWAIHTLYLNICILLKQQIGSLYTFFLGFPDSSGKESAGQPRRCKMQDSIPEVGKIPWSRKWQPTPVFLPGKSHGQEEPGGLQSMDSPRIGHH